MALTATEDMSLLLDEERECLRMGRFERLGQIADRKERLLQSLAAMPSGAEHRALARSCVHNQALLAAARRGLAAAQSRIAALSGPDRSRGIYDAEGQRRSLGGSAQDFELRA